MNNSLWNDRPFVVIWEATRCCALACRHCRATANRRHHPDELQTSEAKKLIDSVARANPGIFIITGGDPMQREDLLELIAYASGKGLRVALSPSATPKFLEADLKAYHQAGIKRMSFSLDGADPMTHDAFRGVDGTAELTMQAIQAAQQAGIEIQINTTMTRQNIGEFEDFKHVLSFMKPVVWTVFLLVPTGRGKVRDMLNGAEVEVLFQELADWEQHAPYQIKTTEGQHFRRVAQQRWQLRGGRIEPKGVPINDGKGFVFISHTGEVCPSGFLPLVSGNVRREELIDVYRNAPVFKQLRDPDQLKGKCGRCEFRSLCGGSRARAYAVTGDYLAQEPLCIYQPAARSAKKILAK
jgi:AdoMet-dependent heme synthase